MQLLALPTFSTQDKSKLSVHTKGLK